MNDRFVYLLLGRPRWLFAIDASDFERMPKTYTLTRYSLGHTGHLSRGPRD